MSEPKNCPTCGLDWTDGAIETLGAARHGGGYRRHCHRCDGPKWDDPQFSYGAKAQREQVMNEAELITADELRSIWSVFVATKPNSPIARAVHTIEALSAERDAALAEAEKWRQEHEKIKEVERLTPPERPDGLPADAVLSAHQLAHAWLDAPTDGQGLGPAEWRAPDGSDVYRFCVIDLDYHMAYLLRVWTPESDAVDMLAVYVRHGRHPEKGWDLDTQWWQHPRPFFEQNGEWLTQAHHWFVEWAFSRSDC